MKILILITIVVLFFYVLIFLPIFKMYKHITKTISDNMQQKFNELNKLIISLSTGTVVLTVSLINQSDVDVFLVFGWIALVLSIISSIMLYLLDYIEEFSFNLSSILYPKTNKDKNDPKYSEYKNSFIYSLEKYLIIGKIKLFFLYLEIACFTLGLIGVLLNSIIVKNFS